MIKEVQQVLFGSLLGDGHVTNEANPRFSEKHCLRQKEYLLWKKFILEKEFAFGKMTREKGRNIAGVRSRVSEKLILIRALFYPNKRKILNSNILQQLGPLALATWYCDDGTYNYQHYYCRIFSYNFNYQEHLLAQNYFRKRWKINCEVQIDARNKCYLHFNAENTRKFLGLIKPVFKKHCFPKCMWYKLGHLYEGNKARIELAKKKKRISNNSWYRNPEVRVRKREYYLVHREKILEQRKIYQQKPEVKEGRKKYMKEYSKSYHRRNRDRINEYLRAWRKRRKLLRRGYDIEAIDNQDWWKRIKTGEYLESLTHQARKNDK